MNVYQTKSHGLSCTKNDLLAQAKIKKAGLLRVEETKGKCSCGETQGYCVEIWEKRDFNSKSYRAYFAVCKVCGDY